MASVTTAQKSSACFEKVCNLLKPACDRIRIPFEGTTLPGYFFKANGTNNKRPTIIATTGHDGTAEELYFYIGAAGIRRGYNVLTFEGPGQGLALREQGLPFRPDWEKAVTPLSITSLCEMMSTLRESQLSGTVWAAILRREQRRLISESPHAWQTAEFMIFLTAYWVRTPIHRNLWHS